MHKSYRVGKIGNIGQLYKIFSDWSAAAMNRSNLT
jgi:hypothetical protein